MLGGYVLQLQALEDGDLHRTRLKMFDRAGTPGLTVQTAQIAKGQQLRWRSKSRPPADVGAVLDSGTLEKFPGPSAITWSTEDTL